MMTTSFGETSRFADYFVITGLDHGSGLEPDKLSGDNLHCAPLDRPFKSKVLAHYPDNVHWNPFDEHAVGMLCLPKGLTFRTQRQRRDNKFHTFLITREDGSRTYGAAYTFYEEVKSRQICAAMKTLQSMHLAELSNDQSRTLYSQVGSPYSPSTPKTVRKLKELEKKSKLYDYSNDTLYVTKCISVITPLPFVDCLHQFLSSLYQACVSGDQPSLALECYVYNLLYEVPLPSPGKSLRFSCMEKNIVCQRPGQNELPFFDFSLQEVFKLLGVENFVNIFTCLLLEHQVLLCSEDYYRLMLVAESLSTLMFPFTWQHVYVPILPASMLHFLDAPVPYVMGIHQGEDRAHIEIPGEGSICVVDIDKSHVDLPEDLPAFPNKNELMEEICKVLKQYGIKDKFDYNSLERRKKSRPSSFENDSGMSSNDESSSISSSISSIPNKMDILQNSDALARITALARKTGVLSSLEEIHDVINDNRPRKPYKASLSTASLKINNVQHDDPHADELKFNNVIREIFFNRFLHMFMLYEEFIIQPTDMSVDLWMANRESMHNYDKAAFLGDQPDTHLPFFSAFIETQMFTSFIDNKIMAKWEEMDPSLKIFEARLKSIKDRFGESRTPTYYASNAHRDTESLIDTRAQQMDHIATTPRSLDMLTQYSIRVGYFPNLNQKVLNIELEQEQANRLKRNNSSKWRKKVLQPNQLLLKSEQTREKFIQAVKLVRQPKLSDMSQASIAKTNWKFVESLLKEVKVKTKRMLVEKMGQEAVDLGHGELTVTGIEENTLIAGLCDLLERIWSHGLQQKQGKCSLWSHLKNFQELQECHNNSHPVDPSLLSPDISALALEGESSPNTSPQKEYSTGSLTRHRRRPSKGPELPTLSPLTVSVLADMRNIQRMTDLKTDVGYARAWVRLALEKKVLSKHLKELTGDHDLLRTLYKRYAFLRCEDEREQFLYHLLSLNAVDYRCFTNTFVNTKIPYKILIFPGKGRFQGYNTTANVWISLAGQLGETNRIIVPKNGLELQIEHKNLGVLTTLRIGHDNSGISPRWMIEHVLVRNELTGHLYRYVCGRWLGKGVDDGSIERLLVGELMPPTNHSEDLLTACSTPPRSVSPTISRKSSSSDIRLRPADIQQMLGDAVNSIVKYFYKPEKERGSLTVLLCGEYGIVNCLEQVFNLGFRSSRFFRNKLYIWDYLEKNMWYFENALSDPCNRLSENDIAVYKSYCSTVAKINASSSSVGKDGKFQLFVCIGLRDHTIQAWLRALHDTLITANMYEENSFLRHPEHFNQVLQLIQSLREFRITLEPSLVKDIPL